VIVAGGGLSGLATALGLALRGRPVTVLESAELLGGAAAYSGGQVWVGANHLAARDGIDDDLHRSESYVRGIAQAYPELLDEDAMRRWLTTAPPALLGRGRRHPVDRHFRVGRLPRRSGRGIAHGPLPHR
jgi:3-oxosteroid 1-dehydrogenase